MPMFTALYDACVLYPAPLRDLLIQLATTRLFHARWTDEIHNEWMRNVLKDRKDITENRLARTRDLMNKSVPDSLVTGYEDLIESLELPDKDDRHVLAAAIRAGSDVIVTLNLKHFPDSVLETYDIEARRPDEFIAYQFDLNPGVVCGAMKALRQRLKNPPRTLNEYMDTLAKQGLPQTIARMKSFESLL